MTTPFLPFASRAVGLAPDEVNSWLLPHVIARASVQARATAKAVLRGLVHRPDRQVYRVLGKRSSSSDVLSVLARQTKAAAATSKSRKHHRSAPNDSEDGSESVLEHHKQAPPDADADADADPGSSSSSSGADSPVTISPTATAANQVLPPPKRRPASGSLPGSPTTSLHFQSGSSATRWAPLPANPTKSVPWVPRWFVVRHNFVFEFASRDDLLPVGCSPLSDAIVHHWPRPHRDSFTLELHVDPKFASSSVGRLFLDIRCTSQREMAAMTSSLERASLMGHDDLYDISSDRLPLGSGRFARVLDVTRKSRAQQKTQAGHHTSDAENSDNKQNNLNDVPAGPPSRDEDVTSRQAQSGEVGDGAVRQERCAIKLIDKRRFWALVHSGKERADTLLREITTQAMLTVVATQMPYLVGAEGIVQLLDVFETKSHIALEVELMEGGDLFHLLDMRVALKEPEAANVVAQVLRALVLLNRHHVAHRDIKLTNLIFDRPPLAPSPSSPPTGDDEQEATGTSSSPADDVADDLDKTERSGTNAGMNSNSTPEPPQGRLRLKLADFGMATFEQGSGGLLHGRCGTPGYVAPEILRAKPLEGYPNTVDMFSTGVVAYTLLCGYEPFYGSTERQLIAANKRCEFAFHLPEWGSISAEAKDFVERLMEPDPAKRPTAAQALQHKWIALHVTPQESEAQKKRRFKRHKKSIAAKAAAAAAVAATNLKDGNETNAARQVVDAAVLAQHHNLSPSSRDARQQQRRRRRRRSSDVKASVVKTRVVNDRGDMLCVVS
jgi:calcium/calmodulin-dependent protein kinase I